MSEHDLQVLEEGVRLSESMLWEMQREAYEAFGVASWTRRGVPFQITSNAYIARQYAEIVAAFLESHRGQRVQLLELGAGSGKFAFLFLKHLQELVRVKGLAEDSFCYLLTDLAEKNVAFWKSHPYFQPFFQKGVLKAAVFDPLGDGDDLLSFDQPLFVMGNYFFDTITQDLFRIEGTQLFEGRISLNPSSVSCPMREGEKFNDFDTTT